MRLSEAKAEFIPVCDIPAVLEAARSLHEARTNLEARESAIRQFPPSEVTIASLTAREELNKAQEDATRAETEYVRLIPIEREKIRQGRKPGEVALRRAFYEALEAARDRLKTLLAHKEETLRLTAGNGDLWGASSVEIWATEFVDEATRESLLTTSRRILTAEGQL